MPANILEILEGRKICTCEQPSEDCPKCRLGYSYKYAEGLYAIDATPADPIIDEKAMAAVCVFARGGNRDFKGDILHVDGINTCWHRSNPGCYLDHGRTWPLPVAKCESPTGQYTVVVDTQRNIAHAKTYFWQGQQLPEQVFDAVAKGLLRAGSIGFRPVEISYLPADVKNMLPAGRDLKRVDLLEVTWTGFPANPEATREYLDRNLACGKSLMVPLRGVLEPFAKAKVIWSPGIGPGESKAMPNNDTANNSLPPGIQQNMPPAGRQPTVIDDAVNDANANEPYGKQLLEALMEDILELISAYTENMDRLEPNDELRGHLNETIDSLNDIHSGVRQKHRERYHGGTPAKKEEDGFGKNAKEEMKDNDAEEVEDEDTDHKPGDEADNEEATKEKGEKEGEKEFGGKKKKKKEDDKERRFTDQKDMTPEGQSVTPEKKDFICDEYRETCQNASMFLLKMHTHPMLDEDHRVLSHHHHTKLQKILADDGKPVPDGKSEAPTIEASAAPALADNWLEVLNRKLDERAPLLQGLKDTQTRQNQLLNKVGK